MAFGRQALGDRLIEVLGEYGGDASPRHGFQSQFPGTGQAEQIGVDQWVSSRRPHAFGENEQHVGGSRPAGEVQQELQRRDIGMVDVVDADHQGAAVRHVEQYLAQFPEEGRGNEDARLVIRGGVETVRQGRERPVVQQMRRALEFGGAQRRTLKELTYRAEWQAALRARCGRADEDRAGLGRAVGEGVQQCCFPRTHATFDEHDPADAPLLGAEQVLQCPEFIGSLD
ncbi:MAG TPA: hypothetical protein VFU43_19910 [Streptosporangiaceae bacterium]|nr:hypothetical protein [Streptosporangiaceae bacterium]